MNDAMETAMKIDAIRRVYSCVGDVLFRSALDFAIEIGLSELMDSDTVSELKEDLNARHDAAEAEGKTLFITRDFELAIVDCAVKLAAFSANDLLYYAQTRMPLAVYAPGQPDYCRLQEIAMSLAWRLAEDRETKYVYDDMESCGITDEEIEWLGVGCILDGTEEDGE